MRENGEEEMERMRFARCLAKAAVVFALLQFSSKADMFVYKDFNRTQGLVMLGDTAPSSCEDPYVDGTQHHIGYEYNEKMGTADYSEDKPLSVYSRKTDSFSKEVSVTDDPKVSKNVSRDTASFGHRDDFHKGYETSVKGKCPIRVRLTPSEPFKRGAVWHKIAAEVTSGFQSEFSFQISDATRSCTMVKDNSFGTKSYESCRVHGGDGFAFVIHGHKNGTSAIGSGGSGMGFSGIPNSLAVKFDTWYNPKSSDLIEDHVVILTKGSEANSHKQDAWLHAPQTVPIADGKKHTVRLVYYPHLKMEYLGYFMATPHGSAFMVDNGRMHRLGTLVLWFDDMENPIVAVPINLSVALRLKAGVGAHIGFTSSTGNVWQKHDLLSWKFCEHGDTCGWVGLPEFDYNEMDLLFPTGKEGQEASWYGLS